MNFYQSELWYHINKHIYEKAMFHTSFLGEKYFGISKIQRKFGKNFSRHMIHGVELGDTTFFSKEVKQALDQISRDYKKSVGDIFFQIGCRDVFDSRPTSEIKQDTVQQELQQKRAYVQSDMWQRYNLKPSWREHMPNATIHLDLHQTPEQLLQDMSESGRRYLNKGNKA
ncbi:MAG: hypothetical protein H6765_04565 [Candidatus Peribacteria bacterium]|nr:MAG: hypothetical protein H6765_04565 [Candidatus Peribacteria bacterium]